MRRHHHRHHHHRHHPSFRRHRHHPYGGSGIGLGLGLLAGASVLNARANRRNNRVPRTIVVQQQAPLITQQPPPGHQAMNVVCPQNAFGGQTLLLTTPSGQMRVQIPNGVVPGQQFKVLVPVLNTQIRQPFNQQTTIPQATYVQPLPQQATYVQPLPQQPQQQQQQQQMNANNDNTAAIVSFIPDMVRGLVRNGQDYLEIRNVVASTIAPEPLTADLKKIIRETIAKEQSLILSEKQQQQERNYKLYQNQDAVTAPSTSYSAQSTLPLKQVAKQLIEFGYDPYISAAAADRCSTVESAMDWISHNSHNSGGTGGSNGSNTATVVNTTGNYQSSNLAREGRRSFSDAMNMPTAPPIFE